MSTNSGDVIFAEKKSLRERSTTLHRACNVVMLIGTIRHHLVTILDYWELFGDYFVTIRDYLVIDWVQLGTIWDYFQEPLIHLAFHNHVCNKIVPNDTK